MFSYRRPSSADLALVTARQAHQELTYPERCATRGSMPAGYHQDGWEADLGRFDEATFDRVGAALLAWQVHLRAGPSVYPPEPVPPGLTFALWFRLAGTYVTAVGRVVYVTSEGGRHGFAYGTLPQHPEQGEEAFHIVKEGSRMVFRVTAFSRPRHPLVRAGAAVGRHVQVRTNQAYLRAMRSVVSEVTP